ncbi:unnamed protein product [Lymnaea stagnalis]|uniref:Ion transport domain-containing protein n=1 Tax=Lymnaea stagnalis TaxID=6523 RepID=A0AAV2IRW2_LYMST
MDPRKRHRKGQIVPGEDNQGFQMDDQGEKEDMAGSPKKSSNDKRPSGDPVLNDISFIANVRAGAVRWKNYATTRRVKKPLSRHQDHYKLVENSEKGDDDSRRMIAGLGLDDNFKPSSSQENGLGKSDGKDKKMTDDINQALIQYFSKLGQSEKENETINLEFVETLLKSGADINCTDRWGQTILHEVARSWHIDVAKYVIENGADVNKGDKYGRTALHVAAAVDYPEMVNLLIEKKANMEAKTEGEGQTPIYYAAKNDAVHSLKALVKKNCRFRRIKDYKGRSPIHVAAELDRSETAKLLLELEAPVYYCDNEGSRAITWMINKMAPVARDALSQFHLTDRPNRKQYFYLNYLVRDKESDLEGKAQTPSCSVHDLLPLHIAVGLRQYDLVSHVVFKRLLDVMWDRYGRLWAWINLLVNFMYIMLWTVIGIVVEYDKRHIYDLPDDGWRIFLFVFAALLTFYQIYEEVMEFKRSQNVHTEWENKRTADIEKDLKYCHPRWPEEEKYLKSEIGEVEKLKPKYFSDPWNIFDWLCYICLLACMATHIADIISHSEILARAHIRLMAVTIILLWLRLMKNARAFSQLGRPFIVMLGHILTDCARFIFLYLEFYIPYCAAFWMIFGGTKKTAIDSTEEVTVSGYTYPGELIFSMFRLTLVDDYDYDTMQQIDSIMADILVGTWFMLSAILSLNLFIALLSDTFQRVYDNAQANAVMQRAIFLLNTWEGMSKSSKDGFLKYIDEHCKPLKEEYDDDMTVSGEDDLKKVTIQIKEDMDNLQEMFKLQFGDPRSSLTDEDNTDSSGKGTRRSLVTVDHFESKVDKIQESFESLKTQQHDIAVKIQADVSTVKSMLRQLLNKGSPKKEVAINQSQDFTDAAFQQGIEDNLFNSHQPSEHTPLTKLKKKKRKPRSKTPNLDIDTFDENSTAQTSLHSHTLLEVSPYSPAFFPNPSNTMETHVFDVVLSPRPESAQLSATDTDGNFTNC